MAHCIDLDLWAVGASCDEAQRSLEAAILGYVKTVLDTDGPVPIDALFPRRAPLRFRAFWYLAWTLEWLRANGAWALNPRAFHERLPLRVAP
jgi:hypothetical protein